MKHYNHHYEKSSTLRQAIQTRIESHTHLEVRSEGLRYERVSLHHLIQHFVSFHSWSDIAQQYLQPWPES